MVECEVKKMNIGVYQGNSQVGAPANDVSNTSYNNPGALALAKETGNTGAIMAKGILSYKDQVDAAKVMQANVFYNDEMAKLRTKLMQDKEGNALDITQRYADGRQDVLSKVDEKYGDVTRYGKTAQAFQTMAEKDWTEQRTYMEKYQANETEKYLDTTLSNSLIQTQNNMASSNYDTKSIDSQFNRADVLVRSRYFNYGQERITAEQNKIKNTLASGLITGAIQANDYTNADLMMKTYGNYLTQDKKQPLEKMINEQIKINKEQSSFSSLYEQYAKNGDLDGYLKAAASMNFNPASSNTGSITTAAAADIGNGYGVNTCTTEVNKWLQAAGYEPINLDAEKAFNSEKIIKDRGQLRDGDIVYWDSHGDGTPWHTGIYNAKTGNVIQSGTHGVSELSLDFYTMLGFSHPRGGKETQAPVSPADQEKQKTKALAYWNQQESIKKNITSRLVEKGNLALESAINSGVTDAASLQAIANQYSVDGSGNVNSDANTKLMFNANAMAKRALSGSGRSSGSATTGTSAIKDAMLPILADGSMNTRTVKDYCARLGFGENDPFTKKMVDANDTFVYGDVDMEKVKNICLNNGIKESTYNKCLGIVKNYMSGERAAGHTLSETDVANFVRSTAVENVGYNVTENGWFGTKKQVQKSVPRYKLYNATGIYAYDSETGEAAYEGRTDNVIRNGEWIDENVGGEGE